MVAPARSALGRVSLLAPGLGLRQSPPDALDGMDSVAAGVDRSSDTLAVGAIG